ncbi:hypothetical protein ACJMK2_034342, partial [Sinanodonta woodiana]
MNSLKNGIFIVQGEISLVVMAMRRSSRWTSHGHQLDESDPLLSSFSQLKDVLNNISELDELEPNAFLSPFLEVIRSEDTTGPITGLALTSVNKILSYGLVDPRCDLAALAIENIADAVTHARFVGTDPGSDEVVLMKILHVLRTLLLSSAGVLLTNESVCEIMQSCFRICFEMRLSELLRKSAEHTLMDMVQLLFSRLPQFKEDPKWSANMKKLKMRTGCVDQSHLGKRKKSPKLKQKKVNPPSNFPSNIKSTATVEPNLPEEDKNVVGANEGAEITDGRRHSDPCIIISEGGKIEEDSLVDTGIAYVSASRESIATTPVEGGGVIDITKGFESSTKGDDGFEQDFQGGHLQPSASQTDLSEGYRSSSEHLSLTIPNYYTHSGSELEMNNEGDSQNPPGEPVKALEVIHVPASPENFINQQGVKFIPHPHHREGSGPLIPYNLPCVRELFRFLISLTNLLDRHNTDVMIHMGLSLLTVALETGADYISQYNSLLCLVKDEMCRNLFMLLQSERLSLFAASLRVCFLLFESLRSHLKLQLEMYLTKLSELITSDLPKVTYETKEIALESIVQLWRIPGLVTELYLNYDCDLYCSNLFEELTKLLSKNAFPVSGLYSTHLLSLDALLTVVDGIEQHCHSRILSATKLRKEEQDLQEDACEVNKAESEGLTYDSRITGPPTSGFHTAQRITQWKDGQADETWFPLPYSETSKAIRSTGREGRKGPQIRPNRMKITEQIPTQDELMAIKHKKRVYHTGTEQFNAKPAKGIQYLQEQGFLKTPLDYGEVILLLKENPKLDKKMIGEYVSDRKNDTILEAFVKSFVFEELRIDEALRLYLETFRLPGEAPVISRLLEHFADHWHKSNGEPFVNADAAFTLAYAVIMLNVDQHNHNVKKQNIPMTVEEFKKNLAKTNGGQDFEHEMLEEIYQAIKNEEIVMPAEHTGLVRENYLWKVLLKRGATKEGIFLHTPTGIFDHDLFTLIWGPTVAALSFVFDKSGDEAIIQKAVSGFRKCAMISAHYCMSDVFDNLVISLCKFTTLLSAAESPEAIPVSFGSNFKAQLAARTVFGLAHRHCNILREGWKNILDCMLQLYRAKLLPKPMVEAEDFVNLSGKISIMKEEIQTTQRSETGVLSSFYSYFTMSEPANTKGPTPEELEASKVAQACIRDCCLEQLINDTKFLTEESLQELVKALVFASQGPEGHVHLGTVYDEDAAVFFFELLVKCVLQNRDRATPIWQPVRDHIYSLVVNANEHTFLVERATVGLLRLSIRLLRREEIASQVLTSLQILIMMKSNVIHSISQQIAYGLHELLRTNAANIHSGQDWYTLFTLLEVVGAGANPPPLLQVCQGVDDVAKDLYEAGAQSDSEVQNSSAITAGGSDRGYLSDSEVYERVGQKYEEFELRPVPDNGSWLLVNQDEEGKQQTKKMIPVNQYSIELPEELNYCDIKSLLKASETLSFLVRDAAHVTPLNFESCVHAIRAFAEASLNGGHKKNHPNNRHGKDWKLQSKHRQSRKQSKIKKSRSSPGHLNSHGCSDDEDEDSAAAYSSELHSLSVQLLDLMHTLHIGAAKIFKSWAEEEQQQIKDLEVIDAGTRSLWVKCWCPLLQGIARLCCDTRKHVRSQALTYLQRALLVHDLQTLSAAEWEACFNKILFPLLVKLLENLNEVEATGLEETRMRAATLLCKVFLQHLSPLLSLSTFTALWLTILDFMDKYMKVDKKSDLLTEAIPESLKNMLLVMDTAGIFHTGDGIESQLWKLTWDRIDTFLPHLKDELFRAHEPPEQSRIDRQGGSDIVPTAVSSQPLLSTPIQQTVLYPQVTPLQIQPTSQAFSQIADPFEGIGMPKDSNG